MIRSPTHFKVHSPPVGTTNEAMATFSFNLLSFGLKMTQLLGDRAYFEVKYSISIPWILRNSRAIEGRRSAPC